MLKHRIIPIILWDGEQAVKTKQHRRPARPVGSMMQHVMTMQERDVDELIIIDIDATYDQREPNYEKISQYAKELYCPLTYGGGVSTLGHIKNLLNAGADKVAIKSAWHERASFIDDAAQKFGAQCVVMVHDVKDYFPQFQCNCGEILLTSVVREGMMNGYDLPLIKTFAEMWDVPIVVNGGAATPQHMYEAIKAGASAVAASSMFLYTDITPKDCARYLSEKGVPCRI